jgi:phosphatidylcholine synthase
MDSLVKSYFPKVQAGNSYDHLQPGLVEEISLMIELTRRMHWFQIRAWLVHLYTSLGLVVGLMALLAIHNGEAQRAFLWFGLALFIDATDGTLARACDVKRWTPNFDGRKLDDITDYLNYAFLPVFFAWRMELVGGWGVVVLPIVLISAVYGFCQTGAKTNDGHFTGFPNFWNVAVLYLYVFAWPQALNALVMALLSVLVFVPFKYISFSTPTKSRLAKLLSVVYGVILALIVLGQGGPVVYLSLIFPLLYFIYPIYQGMNPVLTNSEHPAEVDG